jgi:dynein heavy chain
VYKTTARAGTLSTTGVSTNFILAVDLPSPTLGVEAWVQRGVAIVCDLSE